MTVSGYYTSTALGGSHLRGSQRRSEEKFGFSNLQSAFSVELVSDNCKLPASRGCSTQGQVRVERAVGVRHRRCGCAGRALARTVVDVLEGVREVSVTFISRSEPADLAYPWVESGSAAADEVLGRAGLVVTATSAGEPVVVDRQLRSSATVLAVGAHTVDTRELHEDVLRGAQVIRGKGALA